MDKKSHNLLTAIIYLCLVITFITTLLGNPGQASRLLPLFLLLILSFYLKRIFLEKTGFYQVLARLIFLADIILVYFISMLDMSKVSEIYFYVLMIDATLCYPIKFSILTGGVTYLAYLLVRYARYIRWNTFDFEYFAPALYDNALYFILIFLIVYIAKKQFIQSQILANTMSQLEAKTQTLQETNHKLNESLKELEKMTAINERNRIAREIHDTVGHTLTTVLIEIEAGKRLINKNNALASEKLELAQGQVRKGLESIRLSVRALKEGDDILTLIPAIQSLIRETETHADVKIDFTYDSDLTISEAQGKVLFSALQEGLTNGIRHGRGTEFSFSLKNLKEHILFQLKDNGSGCENVDFGFGLTAMKERVQALGGELRIASGARQGFDLTIIMPISEVVLNEKIQNPGG
jgi:signal transduction histidine kinase